ncbi:MAG: hypothetical protein MJE66_20610 [Proteobacteria bacterium]|nr:hypothetical protein [Pseudomonadota bacterium]
MRAAHGVAAAIAVSAALVVTTACASGGSERPRRDSAEYYRTESIHRSSFPDTFGGAGGPGQVGRPDRQRY